MIDHLTRIRPCLFLVFVFLCSFACDAFAQAGKKGGTDGFHQYNAYTQGKWGVRVGGSGYGTFDSYAYSGNRRYHVYDNAGIGITGGTGSYKVGAFAPSLEVIPYFVIGTSKFLDIGAYLPYYGDLAASIGGLLGEPNGAGEAELWASGFGDLGVWTKIRTELIPEDALFAAAFYFEFDFPTGEEGYGMRVRHPWYYNTEGGYTQPFTAGDYVTIPMLIGTLDFKKKGYAPIRWNNYVGTAIVSNYGANTLIWGTGVNFLPDRLFDSQPDSLDIRFFAELHGESRFQKTDLPRMPLDLDVITTTAGVTFGIKEALEVSLAFEMSFKAFSYLFGGERNTSHGYQNLHESGYYGEDVTATYAISGTPFYGAHLNVSMHFGKPEPPPEPCPVPDTITRIDTVYVTKYDTVEIAATCPVQEKEVCPVPNLNFFRKSVHFKTDSYELEEKSKYVLDELVDLMKMLPDVKLDVFGHTDSVASDEYNLRLSQNRARSAIKYLVENGIDSTRLRAGWSGEQQPVRDNGGEKGRRKNRRVELLPFDKNVGSYVDEKADGSGSDQYEHPADSTQAPADSVESDFFNGAPLYMDSIPEEKTPESSAEDGVAELSSEDSPSETPVAENVSEATTEEFSLESSAETSDAPAESDETSEKTEDVSEETENAPPEDTAPPENSEE